MAERNYNLIELGPRGTGKSFVYRETSPNSILISGGKTTVAQLFALVIAAGVATVLHFAAGLPYLVAFGSVAVSELVLLLMGNALLVRRF